MNKLTYPDKKTPFHQNNEREFLFVVSLQQQLFLKKVLYFFIRNHLFVKNVSSCLRRFNHFDNLSIRTSLFTCLQGCYCFLCHGLILFNFFMYCYSFQNRLVLLKFQSFSSIFSVLRCNITRSTRHTTFLVFCTFKDNLYSITFCFLCHNYILLSIKQLF